MSTGSTGPDDEGPRETGNGGRDEAVVPAPASRGVGAGARHRALIERLQAQAAAAPEAYRRRVLALAALGYAGLALLVLTTVVLPVALLLAALLSGRAFDGFLLLALLPQLLFGGFVLHALAWRFDRPQGHLLAADEAPELQDMVERLRREVGAPPLRGIVVDGDFNAGAAWVPRLGGLLGHTHYLVVGLPLMRALDRDELASVIAHEFGHFRVGDRALTGWVYRIRHSGERLLAAFARHGGPVSWLLFRLGAGYIRYFNAYSFVLARDEEYAADAVSRRVAGAEANVSTELRLAHAQPWLQRRCFEPLAAAMRAQPQPPASLQTMIASALRALPPLDIERVLVAGRRELALEDTHPCPADRIAAAGIAPVLRTREGTAETLLGPALPQIERALDAAWRERARGAWTLAHAAAAPERARLAELERRGTLAPAEEVEYAHLLERLRPEVDALRFFERAVAARPDSASARMRCGLLRIEAGDAGGFAQLRQAIALDAAALRPIALRLRQLRHDPTLPADVFAGVRALEAELAPRAGLDRDGDEAEEPLLAHDLAPDALAQLRALLARQPRIEAAWLARTADAVGDQPRHYLLLVRWQGSMASERAALRQLAAGWRLPGTVEPLSASDDRARGRSVLAACPEPVYRRG